MTMKNRGHQWAGGGGERVEKLITFLFRERMACSYEVKRVLTTRICATKFGPNVSPLMLRFLIAVKQMPQSVVSSETINNYTKYEGRFRLVMEILVGL